MNGRSPAPAPRATARIEGEPKCSSALAAGAKASPLHSARPRSQSGSDAPAGVASSPTPRVLSSPTVLTNCAAPACPIVPVSEPAAPRHNATRAPGSEACNNAARSSSQV